MKGIQIVVISFILVLMPLAACAPSTAPAPQTPVRAAETSAPVVTLAAPATGKQAWETEWERVLAEAKREGKVVLSTTVGGDVRASLQRSFKDAFGITLEVVTGRSAELIPKLLAERRAGLYLSEGGISGYASILTQVKPVGILEPADPMLILPDVTDPERIKKVWYRGQFPWVDKDHTIFLLALQAYTPLIVNTNLVKADEIKSWRDLLSPKWQGKIIMSDPTIAGAGYMAVQGPMALLGEDFLRELAATKPIITRDERLMSDWVALGKVAIVIAPKPGLHTEYIKAGAPIKIVIPSDGTWLSSGASGVYLYKNAPHPNAVKVFANWVTSKEGAEVWARGNSQHSTRLDVSTAYVDPYQMRQEGVKYVDLSTEEASTTGYEAAIKKAKELFGPLVK